MRMIIIFVLSLPKDVGGFSPMRIQFFSIGRLVPLICAISAGAWAAPFPWEGLPQTLPLQWFQTEGGTVFKQELAKVRSPFALDIRLDGKRIDSGSALLPQIFSEKFAAWLPPGAQINISKVGGRLFWDYPVGARVEHAIWLNTTATGTPEPYEVRVLQKLPAGKWAYGVYQVIGGQLKLSQYTGTPEENRQITLQGREVSAVWRRMQLFSCQNCHLATSASAYQYSSLKTTGPCGFGPANGNISDWASRFKTSHGYYPFVVIFR